MALLVKAEDSGNIFYIHQRVGLNGKKIGIYKFRSMKLNADQLKNMLTPDQLEEYKENLK
ncbi:MAG: sugar transferase [Clostridia bacterium]|nr:sugar transferase [Clostridia bacterium]